MYKVPIFESSVENHHKVVSPILQWITTINEDFLKKGFIHNKKSYILKTSEIKKTLMFIEDYLCVENKLDDIIKGKPNDLRNIIEEVNKGYPDVIKSKSNINFFFQHIFIDKGYDDARFNKYNFIKSIKLNTCPYCNRSYIYITTENGVKPQLDHFYPKSIYPFLALSYYNLIPSCPVCNGVNAKHSKDPRDDRYTMINPYEVNNDDFKLSFKLKSVEFNDSKISEDNIDIYFVNEQKIKKHISVFKLDELYKEHSDHVVELIYKSKFQYTEEYRKSLKELGFNFIDEELNRFILGNYAEDVLVHKRPLARLYQDIGKELGLIK